MSVILIYGMQLPMVEELNLLFFHPQMNDNKKSIMVCLTTFLDEMLLKAGRIIPGKF